MELFNSAFVLKAKYLSICPSSLCTELARDLQDEFYPDHYHAVLEGLLPLVNRPDAHVLEVCSSFVLVANGIPVFYLLSFPVPGNVQNDCPSL